MPRLYIANTTKQHHDFMYRTPENQVKTVRIPIGAQVCLGDLSQPDVDAVITQHVKYGMISAREGSRRRGFNGLLYSLEQPVSIDPIEEVFAENDTAMDAAAATRRAASAASAADTVATNMREAGVKLDRAEIETVTDSPNAKKEIAEGFEVVTEGVEPRRGKNRQTLTLR